VERLAKASGRVLASTPPVTARTKIGKQGLTDAQEDEIVDFLKTLTVGYALTK
jgi:hypothetical protein